MKPDDVSKQTPAIKHFNSMNQGPESNIYSDTANLWRTQRRRDSLKTIAMIDLFNLTLILFFNII